MITLLILPKAKARSVPFGVPKAPCSMPLPLMFGKKKSIYYCV